MTHLPPALMLLEAWTALSVPVSLATLEMESLVQVCACNVNEYEMEPLTFTQLFST